MADKTESIEDLYASHDAETSSGLFYKFEDDKEVRIRIATEPYILEARFTDKKTGDVTSSKKYAWVVLNRTDDKAQILQLPGGGYSLVQNLGKDKEDWGNPATYDIKITRKNNNGNYSYLVNGVPKKTPITEEEMALVGDIDIVAAISKNNPNVCTVRQYRDNGNKFPDSRTTASGDTILTSLPEEKEDVD